MNRFVYAVDRLSAWMGKAFAWCILIMTFGVSYEVFVRYVLQDPTSWSFDITYIMYGALFMMGGAYTLSQDGHVRGDVIYRLWPARVQAVIEMTLYVLFFFPGVSALVYAGFDYAKKSWRYHEVSIMSPIGVPIYPFKTLIPIAAAILLLQGIAEVVRCIQCLRTGKWPPRLHDVEEMETAILHQREHLTEMGVNPEDLGEPPSETDDPSKGDGR